LESNFYSNCIHFINVPGGQDDEVENKDEEDAEDAEEEEEEEEEEAGMEFAKSVKVKQLGQF
jgi:hypothetical protein